MGSCAEGDEGRKKEFVLFHPLDEMEGGAGVGVGDDEGVVVTMIIRRVTRRRRTRVTVIIARKPSPRKSRVIKQQTFRQGKQFCSGADVEGGGGAPAESVWWD